MVELITAEVIQAVGSVVAEYAFGRVGDNLLDSFSTKRKIKKILGDDKKFIEKQFKNQERRLFIIVEEFLFKDIFQDPLFLYPVSNIPEDRAALLWERFYNYAKKANYDGIDIPSLEDECRIKLGACTNYHNELINKYLLSESERIILKTIHRNQSDLLGYIGKTLDSNSELQFENYKLDYTHKQIEGILHALRMDMRHYKFLLILYSIGIIIVELVSIIMLPRIIAILGNSLAVQSVAVFVTIVLIIALIFSLLLRLFYSTIKNVQNCERRISAYMEALWDLHFINYSIQVKSLFASDYNESSVT